MLHRGHEDNHALYSDCSQTALSSALSLEFATSDKLEAIGGASILNHVAVIPVELNGRLMMSGASVADNVDGHWNAPC